MDLAEGLKGNGTKIYTLVYGNKGEKLVIDKLGTDNDMNVNQFLAEISTKTQKASLDSNLADQFGAVATKIASGLTGANATVTDTKAPNITSDDYGENDEFTWNLGEKTPDTDTQGDTTTYTYTKTYTVKLDADKAVKGAYNPLNGETKLQLPDGNSVNFPIPAVYVAEPAPVTYTVKHIFKNGTDNRELPDEVKTLCPEDQNGKKTGDIVKPTSPAKTEVKVDDGTWKFEKWDAEEKTIENADVTFTGTWIFEETSVPSTTYKVTYEFKSGTEGKELPDAVKTLCPVDQTEKNTGDAVNPTTLGETEVKVDDGTWKFDKWDAEEKTIENADVTFTGTWIFEAAPVPSTTYKVTYHANYSGSNTTFVSDNIKAGDTYTVLSSSAAGISRSGYSFTRWTTEATGGTAYSAGAKINNLTANLNLYAQWSRNGGGRPSNPPVVIPDDPTPQGPTPDLLNTDDHYAYIVGYPAENGQQLVKPEGDITRAEVATIFFRMLTEDNRDTYWSQTGDYADVAAGAWYTNAVYTLSNADVLTGYPDGTFRPNGKITRAEFATVATRFFQIQYEGPDFFSDVADHWAQDYINQAASASLVNGYPDGTFGPQKNITRAEAVTMVNRILGRAPDKDHLLSDMVTWPDNPESAWYYADVQEASNSHDYTKSDGSETWTKMQPIRDWAALEKQWADSHASANPGEVMDP